MRPGEVCSLWEGGGGGGGVCTHRRSAVTQPTSPGRPTVDKGVAGCCYLLGQSTRGDRGWRVVDLYGCGRRGANT